VLRRFAWGEGEEEELKEAGLGEEDEDEEGEGLPPGLTIDREGVGVELDRTRRSRRKRA
jgi:hypothetical protein